MPLSHPSKSSTLDFAPALVGSERLRGGIPAPDRSSPDDDRLPVRALGGSTRLIARASITLLQARGDYVRVFSDEGRFLLQARLGDFEEEWSAHGFQRVHRGFVVNLRRVVEFRPKLNRTASLVMSDGSEVPVARRHVAALRGEVMP